MSLLYQILSALFIACFPIGFIMIALDRLRRPAEASEEDVRRAVERYRQCYGQEVQHALADHIHGARLAGDFRHRRLLRRVAERIRAEDGPAPLRLRRPA